MSVQISAYIEDDIKKKMETYSSANGLKKGFLIQNALDYYLNALHEIPSSMITASHIAVNEETFHKLLNTDNQANSKLKELLEDD